MEASRVYGIDLGTTYSCIAYVDQASGKSTVVTNAEGDLTTPSVVLFEDEHSRVVGKEAKNSATLDADRVVEMFKRQMGVPNWRFAFGDHDYSPEEISSYVLRKVADDAKMLLDTTVRDVVITCPAYFGIAQRDATAKAGEIAELNVRAVLNEPTAAAIAYGLHEDRDQVVLVYDLGGGTFDVTMIEIKDGSITVVATGGDHWLGGRNWDEEIVGYLSKAWQAETGSAEDPCESEATQQDLWQRAEDAKRALSARTETRVAVNHAGQRAGITLTREKFDELTEHLLERTIQYTKEVLATAKDLVGVEKFDTLLLVGGSTRMPQVAQRLTAEFGITPTVHDPDHAVAKGAAIYGQKLALGDRIDEIVREHGSESDFVEAPQEVQDQAVQQAAEETGMRPEHIERLTRTKVVNVASHSFGVVAVTETDGVRKEIISNLVLAQAPLPSAQQRTYYTDEANQPVVDLRIMENTKRDQHVEMDDGQEVGSAVLAMTPGLPELSPVEVSFELSPDGRLQVKGRDLADEGEEITAVIETGRSLSAAELEQAKSRSRGIRVSG